MTAENDRAAELQVVREALAAEYEVLQELGRGGMAVVYRARDLTLGRDVAIKVLPFSIALDSAVVERFQREARTAAQLEHPHIVPIYRVGRAGQVIYFVMQLLRGQSLGDRLLEHGKLKPKELRRLLLEVGGALGYAARHGVVHRDVKPDNIMVDSDGRSVVTDFGIARSASESRLTATGMSVGTPRYMSPEQARAKPMDGRSDLYSLGVVGYESLVGRPPFDGEDPFAILMAHINTPPPTPPLKAAEEREIYAVVERMLAKLPEDRYQSAEEMIAALEGGPAGAAPHAARASAGSRAKKPLAPTAPAQAAVADADGDAVERPLISPALKAMAAQTTAKAVTGGKRGWRWATDRGPRFWSATAGAFALIIGGYWAGHFAIMHRSRCAVEDKRGTPPLAESTRAVSGTRSAGSDTRSAGNGTKSAAPTPRSLSLLVDAIDPASTGDEIDVYYDVCGLAEDTPFTTRIDVVRNQSGLRKLFGGGASAVTGSFDETASSPATRRHREIDLGTLPEGAYSVRVSVTDDKERRRERSVPLQITP